MFRWCCLKQKIIFKMKAIFLGWFVLFLPWYHGMLAFSYTNFVVKRFEDCSKDNSTKFLGNITHKDGKQYLDFDITLLRDLDATVGSTSFLQHSLDGKTFIPLFTIRAKYLCKGLNTYLGEFWYDIARATQIPPGVCPIHARRYYAHQHLLNFEKVALQTFPFGWLRVTFNAIDNNHKAHASLFCMFFELENVPN